MKLELADSCYNNNLKCSNYSNIYSDANSNAGRSAQVTVSSLAHGTNFASETPPNATQFHLCCETCLKAPDETEAVRPPGPVLEYKNGQYKLQCRHSASIEILGSAIRTEPEILGNKEVTVSFANNEARENNHGTVTAAQEAGKKANNKASP